MAIRSGSGASFLVSRVLYSDFCEDMIEIAALRTRMFLLVSVDILSITSGFDVRTGDALLSGPSQTDMGTSPADEVERAADFQVKICVLSF